MKRFILHPIIEPPPRYRHLPILLLTLCVVSLFAFGIFSAEMENAIPFWKKWWQEQLKPVESGELRVERTAKKDLGDRKQEIGEEKPPSPEELAALDRIEIKEKHRKPYGQMTDEERKELAREKTDARYKIALHVFEELKRDVAQHIARNDFSTAYKLIDDFRQDKQYSNYIISIDIDKIAAAVRDAETSYNKKNNANVGSDWANAEVSIQQLLKQERFDDALQIVEPFKTHRAEAIRKNANSTAKGIQTAKERWLKDQIPNRPALYQRLFLTVQPFLTGRNYPSALDHINKNAKEYAQLGQLLEMERERLSQLEGIIKTASARFSNYAVDSPIILKLKDGTEVKGKFKGLTAGGGIRIALEKGGEMEVSARQFSAEEIFHSKDERTSPRYLELLLYDVDFENVKKEIGVRNEEVGGDYLIRLDLVATAVKEREIANAIALAEKHYKDGDHQQVVSAVGKLRAKYPDGLSPQLLEFESKSKDALAKQILGDVNAGKLAILKTEGNVDEKVRAITALRLSGNKDIYPFIADALKDPSSRVRMEAVKAMGDITELRVESGELREIIGELMKLLDDPIEEVGSQVIETLQKIPDENIYPLLAKYIEGEDVNKRRQSAIAFGYISKKFALSHLLKHLKDENWEVRKVAVGGFVHLNDASAAGAILSALKDETDERVASACAYALGYFKYANAVSTLEEKLKERRSGTFAHIYIKALGSIAEASEATASRLQKYLKAPDEWIRYYALEGIYKSTLNVSYKDVELLLSDRLWQVRTLVVLLLSRTKNEKALSKIISALDDEDESVKYAAVQGLMEWRDVAVVKELIYALDKLSAGYGLAKDVLKELTKQDFSSAGDKVDEIKLWRKWWRESKATFQMPKR